MKPSSLRALIGGLLSIALLGALYLFKENTLNTLVYFIIIIIAGLAAGVLTNFISGRATFDQQEGNRNLFATEGKFVFLFVVCGGIWFYLNTNQTFDFTIYLRGKQGETALKDQAQVTVLLNNSPRRENIDQFGRVVISGIPAELKETAVTIELKGTTDWIFENGQKIDAVLLTGKNATLTIMPSKAICCITGHVTGADGKPSKGATLWAADGKPVLSDSVGHFSIDLPPAMQLMESIQVFARRNGVQVSVHASPRQPVSILLTE